MIKKLKRNRKKIILTLVFSVALFGLGAYVLHIMRSPAVGTVTLSQSKTDTPVLKDDTDYSTLSNDYYTLLYPSELTTDFPDLKPKNAMAYNFLSVRDANHELKNNLEVYVRDLPYGGVTLDSNYKDYLAQPKLYKFSSKYFRGELVDIVTRNSGSVERGALWVHGDYLMIVKLKGSDKGEIDNQFNTILKSVQWLKS